MTSCDASTADRLRLFAGHGMRPRYYHQVVGINSRLDTFQAAVLRVKLKHLPAAVEARSSIAERYGRMLTDLNLVGDDAITLLTRANAFHVWINMRSGSLVEDVMLGPTWPRMVCVRDLLPVPMHRRDASPICRQTVRNWRKPKGPSKMLNLPIFPGLTEPEQCRVVEWSLISLLQQQIELLLDSSACSLDTPVWLPCEMRD